MGRSTEDDGDESTVETDRGLVCAPLVVDALGWRRILAADDGFQPLDAPLTRALEVHPHETGDDLEVWVDRRYVPAGYGWSLPRRRRAADRRLLLRAARSRPRWTHLLAADLRRRAGSLSGQLDPARAASRRSRANVFFAGDSAGQCLPLTAEGIRTALYFGIAVGRELRAVIEGRRSREEASARYAEFVRSHRRGFRLLLFVQRLIPRIPRDCWRRCSASTEPALVT